MVGPDGRAHSQGDPGPLSRVQVLIWDFWALLDTRAIQVSQALEKPRSALEISFFLFSDSVSEWALTHYVAEGQP